ncbi:amino acid transporter [Lophium mytilinum]|uniref:Amino acid transporter n=1 Tax=Lophium mytilinum TaxID=390894 RepID=A0A6A6QHL6_9PEZI|nr:amino acid transporter [Lophium mytilinum]
MAVHLEPLTKEISTSKATPALSSDGGESNIEVGYASNTIKEKAFSVWSLLAVAFTCGNAPITLLASLAAGISNGGAPLFIYGTIVVAAASACVACSLAELSSAFPHAGGQFHWMTRLTPERYRRPLSYLVAFLSWAGAVVTCASAMLTVPLMVIGMISMNYPDIVIDRWMVFVGYQCTNIFCAIFNCVERVLPKIALANLVVAVAATITIFISVLVASPTKQSAEFVFVAYENSSGWSDGIAFLTGLLAANWGFSCIDSITHLADEVPEPQKNIPKALMWTVALGVGTCLPIAIATFFSVSNLDDIVSTPTGLPSLEAFYQCLGSKKGAIALESLMAFNFLCAGVSIQTWQSRLAWALACDKGLPFSRHLSLVASQPFDVPIWAHLWSCAWVAILGCLYLGSTEAFNAFIGGGLLLQYLSYSACVIALLIHGRKNITPGPFWLPRFGPVANCVTIGWTLLTLVFYSFPAYIPTTAMTMNYVSCVIVFVIIYAAVFWAGKGRKTFILSTSGH